jgi:hypothetical protein
MVHPSDSCSVVQSDGGTVYLSDVVTTTATYTSTQTVTATLYQKQRRFADLMPRVTNKPKVRREDLSQMVDMALQQIDGIETYDPSVLAEFGPQISSACTCLQLGPAFTDTVTATYNFVS